MAEFSSLGGCTPKWNCNKCSYMCEAIQNSKAYREVIDGNKQNRDVIADPH